MNLFMPPSFLGPMIQLILEPSPWFWSCFACGLIVLLILELQQVHPTSEDLSSDVNNPLPLLVRVIDYSLGMLPFTVWDVSDPAVLLEKGAIQADLPANYSPNVVEAIGRLCASFKSNNVNFHWIGRWNMHDTIVSGLSHYLQVKDAHRLNPKLSDIKLKDPLIVVGLPRSGTTHLHRVLSLAPDSMSLALWQHFYPVYPKSGFDFRRLSLKAQFIFWKYFANRFGLDSVHYVRPDLPDECTFSLRLAGSSHLFWSMAPVYDYMDWLANECDVTESYESYRRVLQMMQACQPDKRFVLKCPSHAMSLEALTKAIPEANIIFTHRCPRGLIGSEASLITRLQATSVKALDWRRTAKMNAGKVFLYSQRMAEYISRNPNAKIFHASYTKLLADPLTLIQEIHDFFGLQTTQAHMDSLVDYLSQNRQHSHGKHHYSNSNAGLTTLEVKQGLDDYVTTFAQYLPPASRRITEKDKNHNDFDAIVVGAGISGLVSANRILEEQPAATVLLLEAHEQVGGRVKSAVSPKLGIQRDVGGTYVGPSQDRILRLADRFGIDSYEVFNKGDMMFHNTKTGQVVQGSIDIPPLSAFALLDFNAILVRFEKMAEEINIESPSSAARADELDSTSVQCWIEANAKSEEVKEMFPRVVDTIICKSSMEVSMLYWLWYAKSGDSLKRLMDVANGAQERKFKCAATAQIPQKLADNFLGLGGQIRLGSPVLRIDQTSDDVVSVVTTKGEAFSGKRLIVALPPNHYSKIEWNPALPNEKALLSQNYASGSVIKTIVFYKAAWWRQRNLNGQIWDVRGPITYCLDDSGCDGSCPAIMGFILAKDADVWTSKTLEERKTAILEQYRTLFQTDQALEAVDYMEHDWVQEKEYYTRGGAVSIPKLGTFVGSFDQLRVPFKRVHFAGTELATRWAGYMDGGIQSGERAADEVKQSLYPEAKIRSKTYSPMIAVKPAAPGILEKGLAVLFEVGTLLFIKNRHKCTFRRPSVDDQFQPPI